MICDPDGFIGTLLAIEGIIDARAVMNGPTGCRGNPAYFSDRHFPRENSLNRRSFEELFFFGQSRIPCTYLDRDDYILGSAEKFKAVLPLVATKGDTFLAVVNSPGASLIGDDLNRFLTDASLDSRCMAIEGALYSHPFSEGFDSTIAAILRWLKLNHLTRIKNRVNLLGFSMYQKYWQGNIAEINHLCELLGLIVVSVPGGGCSIAEMRESTTASYNLIVFPEYCRKTAKFYEDEFGIPAIYSHSGAPVGFGPTEQWIEAIANATGQNPAPALEYVRKKRIHAFHQLSRYHHEAGYPKGATFAIRGDSSFVYPLTAWLYEYLGMLPVSVNCVNGEDGVMIESLKKFLEIHNLSPCFQVDAGSIHSHLYFGDSLTGKDLELSGRCTKSVELYNRTTNDIYFTERTFLGGKGALWLLDLVFNAICNI